MGMALKTRPVRGSMLDQSPKESTGALRCPAIQFQGPWDTSVAMVRPLRQARNPAVAEAEGQRAAAPSMIQPRLGDRAG